MRIQRRPFTTALATALVTVLVSGLASALVSTATGGGLLAASPALAQPAPAAPGAPAPMMSSEDAPLLLRQQGCKAHYLIAVPGGANTAAGIPTFVPHGGQVFSTGLLTQAATAGRVQPLWVSYNAAAFAATPYAAASAEGYAKTRGAIARLAQSCPRATFALTGYSLGADIAARLTRDIAYGTGPIQPDRLAAVALIANPYQGGNGAVLSPSTSPDSRGALGELKGGYGELADKVLEICRPDDIVCSMDERYRDLVDPAMRTNLIAGRVPVAEFSSHLGKLGFGSVGVLDGIGAHGRYGVEVPQAAADWIVSHTGA